MNSWSYFLGPIKWSYVGRRRRDTKGRKIYGHALNFPCYVWTDSTTYYYWSNYWQQLTIWSTNFINKSQFNGNIVKILINTRDTLVGRSLWYMLLKRNKYQMGKWISISCRICSFFYFYKIESKILRRIFQRILN